MITVDIVRSIDDLDPADWDALAGDNNPFLEHAFLTGLERSGSVGTHESGWLPRHLTVRYGGRLVGAMPLYEKYDSYGEFIFDWSWAQAAARAGLVYYPKLVSAVPFTPATGPRLLVGQDAPTAVMSALVGGLRDLAADAQVSSIHVLFCTEAEKRHLAQHGLLPRSSYQYHWQRQATWNVFSDYLNALRAPARKQVRRERQAAAAHGLNIVMRRGTELGQIEWDALYYFYRHTIAEKGAVAYLTRAFFAHLQRVLPHRVLAAMAYDQREPVAGALYLTKGNNLYGRYWGSAASFDALHFELCYYLPIEWGLQHGITRFEAGAQGDHKMKRGLLPTLCHSAHAIGHPGLAAAVQDFLPREAAAIDAEILHLQQHTPYQRGP